MPRRKKQTTNPTSAAPRAELFKTKDIKEDVLIDRVIRQAGVPNDAETTGFIKAVLPRFAESNPRQAFSSMSKMVKEFGRGSGQSNGSDVESGAEATTERRRPGRPPGSKNKAKTGNGGPTNERGQASAGVKRRPGRPRKVDHPQA